MKAKQDQVENQTRRNRLFQASVIVILILALAPGNGKVSIVYFDKFIHFSMFLALSINACYRYRKDSKRLEVLIWIILFGLLIEVAQQFVPHRDMDLYDGIADTIGVIAGYYLYRNNQIKLDKLILKLGA